MLTFSSPLRILQMWLNHSLTWHPRNIPPKFLGESHSKKLEELKCLLCKATLWSLCILLTLLSHSTYLWMLVCILCLLFCLRLVMMVLSCLWHFRVLSWVKHRRLGQQLNEKRMLCWSPWGNIGVGYLAPKLLCILTIILSSIWLSHHWRAQN